MGGPVTIFIRAGERRHVTGLTLRVYWERGMGKVTVERDWPLEMGVAEEREGGQGLPFMRGHSTCVETTYVVTWS